MKILVTGSNGFIGSTLTEKLLQQGHEVTCLVRRSSDLRWLKNLPVTLNYANLLTGEGLAAALEGCGMVFHLAGVTKAQNRQGYWDGNVAVTRTLLAFCAEQPGLQKFVYVSSQAAAGPSLAGIPLTEADEPYPISVYGQCKLAAEKEVLAFSQRLPITIVRPPSVYGPKDRDILAYFQTIHKGALLVLGQGTQTISLVHVSDLVQGILLAAQKPASTGKVFFISGDGEYNWLEIGRTISQAMNRKAVTIKIPLWLLKALAPFSTLAARITGKPALLNQDKILEMIQPGWLCSNQLAKKELGFCPRMSLLQGASETAQWYRQNGWL